MEHLYRKSETFSSVGVGPHLFDYNPQKPLEELPLLTSLILDMLERYTDSAELSTLPGEQARGYIGEDVYILYDNGEIKKALQ